MSHASDLYLHVKADVSVHQGQVFGSFWKFEITLMPPGMLTSLGPKTLEEIQRNLESFEDDYEQTLQGLELFMLSARQEGMVDQSNDGKWSLLSST